MPSRHISNKRTASSADLNDDDQQQQQQTSSTTPNPPNSNMMSSSTAPLSTSKKKQHQHLLMVQLRNAIYETYQAPPDGATEEMVLERREQLETLLKTLETQFQQSKNEALEAYNNRWMKSMSDQVNKERTTQRKIEEQQQASEKQYQEWSAVVHGTIEERNKRRKDRTVRAASYNTQKKKETLSNVLNNVRKQDERYNMIQERRREEARMWQQRQIDAERHCQEMLDRKAERDEQYRREKEEKAERRRREAEERLDALRERKDQQARDRAEAAREHFRKANVVKIAVDLRAKDGPKMINIEIPYEQRLANAEKAQQEREEKARQRKKENFEFWQMQVGARHRKNLEYQQRRRDQQLREHDERCSHLQDSIRRANRDAEDRKRQRDQENFMRSIMKDEEISEHRNRHANVVHDFQDDAKKRVFDRWNRQLVQVSAELGVPLPENLQKQIDESNNKQNRPNSQPGGAGPSSLSPLPSTNKYGSAKFLPGVGRGANNHNNSNQYATNDDPSSTFLTQQRGGTPAKLGNFVGN